MAAAEANGKGKERKMPTTKAEALLLAAEQQGDGSQVRRAAPLFLFLWWKAAHIAIVTAFGQSSLDSILSLLLHTFSKLLWPGSPATLPGCCSSSSALSWGPMG